MLRALTALNDIEGLKAFLQGIMNGDGAQKANAQGFTILAQYLMQNKIDETFVENSMKMLEAQRE